MGLQNILEKRKTLTRAWIRDSEALVRSPLTTKLYYPVSE